MSPFPRWLPAKVYEFLPTLYVLAGSLFAAYGPGSIGKPSAIHTMNGRVVGELLGEMK